MDTPVKVLIAILLVFGCADGNPSANVLGPRSSRDGFPFTVNGDEYRLYTSPQNFSTAISMCKTLGGPDPESIYFNDSKTFDEAVQHGMEEYRSENDDTDTNFFNGVWTPNSKYSKIDSRCQVTLPWTAGHTNDCNGKRPFVCQRDQMCFPGKNEGHTFVANYHLFLVGTLLKKTAIGAIEYCRDMNWTLAFWEEIINPKIPDFGCPNDVIINQPAWVFDSRSNGRPIRMLFREPAGRTVIGNNFTNPHSFICQKECDSLACGKGGYVDHCRCRCRKGYSGVTCACKHRGCRNGGFLNEATCSCVCQPWYVGEFCGCKGLICGKGEYINEQNCTCGSIQHTGMIAPTTPV